MSKLNNLIDNINNKGKTNREWLSIHGEGTYLLRICPDISDEEQAPFEVAYLHSGFTHPFYKKRANVPCLRTKDCPMCIEAEKIKIKTFSEFWRYKSTPFYLYNVIDRYDGKLKILKASQTLHDAIKMKILEAARQGINLMSVAFGRDLEIVIRSINNKLNYKAFIVSEKETKPFAGKILEELNLVKPLNESYKRYSKIEIQDIVDGKITDFKNLKQMQEKRKTESKASLIERMSKNMNLDLNKKEQNSLNIFEESNEGDTNE